MPSTLGAVVALKKHRLQARAEQFRYTENHCLCRRTSAASVQTSLSSISATECKIKLTGEEEKSTDAEETDELFGQSGGGNECSAQENRVSSAYGRD